MDNHGDFYNKEKQAFVDKKIKYQLEEVLVVDKPVDKKKGLIARLAKNFVL